MTGLALRREATPARAPRQIPRWTGAFFHDDTPGGAGYRGLERGRRLGYLNADMNFNACKPTLLHPSGVLINTHWIDPGHDGFTSRSGFERGRRFAALTWGQVRRLRTRHGDRIYSIHQIIRRAAHLGYTHLEIELKDGVDRLPHRKLVALIRAAGRYARLCGLEVYFKTLSNIGNPLKRLRAIHAAGEVSVLLPRGDKPLRAADYWPVTDYVRGTAVWS